jgi:hypothetical protein
MLDQAKQRKSGRQYFSADRQSSRTKVILNLCLLLYLPEIKENRDFRKSNFNFSLTYKPFFKTTTLYPGRTRSHVPYATGADTIPLDHAARATLYRWCFDVKAHMYMYICSQGLACPNVKNHRCQYLWDFQRLPFRLPVTSLEVQRQTLRNFKGCHWKSRHPWFFILIAALVCS